MKIIMIALLLIWVFYCKPQNLQKCKEEVCLMVDLELNGDTYFVIFEFKSHSDIKIAIDRKAFFVGCPLHQEVQPEFDNFQEGIERLKFSQLIIENEGGKFRIYSTQRWYWPEDELVEILHVNCSLFGFEYFHFGQGDNKFQYKMKLADIRDLRVTESDKKIRLYYFFKPHVSLQEEGYGELLICSSNWISVEQ